MKRIIGNFLIVFSIVCAVATVLWFGTGLAGQPENPGEDDRTMFSAMILFFVVLLSLECAIFLCGRYLRRRYPDEVPEQTKIPHGRRVLPLIISLGCSIAITMLAFLAKKFLEIKALAFVIGQPYVLAQLIFGGLMAIKLDSGVMKQMIVIAFNLLYYLALFYPVFRIVTMDRNEEVVRYRLMKTLLVIFVSVHILMGFVMAMLFRA
jgi:hypothetical protein